MRQSTDRTINDLRGAKARYQAKACGHLLALAT
jgi:hypothetical protein